MATKLAGKAPSWFSRILMPEIVEIKGKLKTSTLGSMQQTGRIDSVNERIDSTSSRIDSHRNELKSEIARLESRFEEFDK